MTLEQQIEENSPMSVNNIINALQNFDSNKPIVINMKEPIYGEDSSGGYSIIEEKHIVVTSDFCVDSWRGSYALPSIGYSINGDTTTVGEALENIKDVDGTRVDGYKGGEFTLSSDDTLFIANYGDSNNATAIVNIRDEGDIIVVYTNYDMY